jgi:2-methylcitrate dehydratase PrpD
MANSTAYTLELADFAATTRFDSLPATFLALLPVFILDVFASMLAGAVQPVYLSSVEAVKLTYGNNGHATAVDGTTTSLSGAMFLNGIAGGDFEFEHVTANAHPASAVFPALLTVASRYKKSGKQLLTAMAVGYELATRIGAASTTAVETTRGFHNPGLNGALASAAAVCNLMGWDNSTESAMGLAASSSAGLLAFVNTGAMTKRLHPARAGQLGAEAAFLAHANVTGPAGVLEDPEGGFLHAFSPAPEAELLTQGLGLSGDNSWTAEAMILKLSPVHAYTQVFVYAVNQYRSNHTWTADDIDSVTLHCSSIVSTPSHWIPSPATLVDAQYSVPFGIAASLTADLRDPLRMNDALLQNATALSLAADIQAVNTTTNVLDGLGGSLILHMRNGQNITIAADTYPGAPGASGFADAAVDKYRRVTQSLGIDGSLLQQRVMAVESLPDVSVLLAGLVEASVSSNVTTA